MSNIINAVKLDFYTVKSVYKRAALTYLISVIFGFVAQPIVSILIIMLFTVFYSGMAFSIYEKNNLNKLYGFLPLEKSDVVIGRYIYALIFGIIQAGSAVIVSYAISLILHAEINNLLLIAMLSLSFLYFCFAIGISFPIYFKFGFSKVYVFTMVPLFLVILAVIFIGTRTNALNFLKGIILYFYFHQGFILPSGVGLGIILLAISGVVSYSFYKKSEL